MAATLLPDGVISPGGIGYDINCGVRLLATQLDHESAAPYIDALATALNQHCPTGVGEGGTVRLSDAELDQVCREGSRWALKRGYRHRERPAPHRRQGRLEGADPASAKPARPRARPPAAGLAGRGQSLHRDRPDRGDLRCTRPPRPWACKPGCLALQIHCGSRGFGHQICTDYVEEFQAAVRRYKITLPDRELVCAPLSSPEGQNYLAAMRCAANYAFANRQLLAHAARQAFEQVLAGKVKHWQLTQVYDIAHNMGKIETHIIDGKEMKVCVHRKGATRAFGPGAPDLPEEYRHDRPAGAGAGQHGHRLVGAGGHAAQHGAVLWLHLPRRRAADEPPRGQAQRARRDAAPGIGKRRHHHPRRVDVWPGGRGPAGL